MMYSDGSYKLKLTPSGKLQLLIENVSVLLGTKSAVINSSSGGAVWLCVVN